jgi:predicted nucleic acid-binding protein
VRIAFDTNVLVYAEGLNDHDRAERARTLLARVISAHEAVVPVQVLAELFSVLKRRTPRSPEACRNAVLGWADLLDVQDTTAATMRRAVDLVLAHRFAVFDAIILTAASEANCRFLLSEDLQDGFTWGGVTVVNPFGPSVDAALDAP